MTIELILFININEYKKNIATNNKRSIKLPINHLILMDI